jgi:hypothetical protein
MHVRMRHLREQFCSASRWAAKTAGSISVTRGFEEWNWGIKASSRLALEAAPLPNYPVS